MKHTHYWFCGKEITPREKDIITLCLVHPYNKAIAEALGIKPATLENELHLLSVKLSIHGIRDLMILASKNSVITTSDHGKPTKG